MRLTIDSDLPAKPGDMLYLRVGDLAYPLTVVKTDPLVVELVDAEVLPDGGQTRYTHDALVAPLPPGPTTTISFESV